MKLRDYQIECLDVIEAKGPGRWLCQLATGTGKTIIFAHIPRHGRTLILSHRDELVRQPIQYFTCYVGVEKAQERSHGEEVVSASVQSLVRRLHRFSPSDFDTIIIDEAQHASCSTNRTIVSHFHPRRILGFTATPNRGDGVRLDDIFDEIIFERDLRWGIENGWLANIECLRANIGYDLSKVRSSMGDFAVGELEKAVNIEGANKAIAEVYQKYAIDPTLIFSVGVEHARNIAAQIPGAVALSAESKNRWKVLDEFKNNKIPCLVNCMLFTEGTDLPNVRTVMMCRPTQSVMLFTQMVGRGTRRTEEKDTCKLIDCIGVSRFDLCTAPSLIGIDASQIPEKYQLDLVGDLINDLPELINQRMDTPETWIKNVQIVNLWAKREKINLRGVHFFKHADGMLSVSLPDRKWLRISAPDLRGQARLYTSRGHTFGPAPLQACIDHAWQLLHDHAQDQRPLWSRDSFQRWGRQPASDKQRSLVSKFCDINLSNLTKGEANLILRRKFSHAENLTNKTA